MKKTNSNGGPAFPLPTAMTQGNSQVVTPNSFRGMSLRDYFAAQIAAGDAAAGEGWQLGSNSNSIIRKNAIESRARFYYEMADAMLRAREAV